jgi:hypothetical protein
VKNRHTFLAISEGFARQVFVADSPKDAATYYAALMDLAFGSKVLVIEVAVPQCDSTYQCEWFRVTPMTYSATSLGRGKP